MKRSEEIDEALSKRLSVVGTDIDDTVTEGGKITVNTLGAFEKARRHGMRIVLITGRSAGCGLTLSTYLEQIDAVVAENGGVVIRGEEIVWHRARTELAEEFHRDVLGRFPSVVDGNDNFMRLFDYTLDINSMSPSDVQHICKLARDRGLRTTHSTVHLHIYDADVTKGTTFLRLLNERKVAADSAITIGDSMNDESLFDSRSFPNSCWVGLKDGLESLSFQPTYYSSAPEAQGLIEVIDHICRFRRDGVFGSAALSG